MKTTASRNIKRKQLCSTHEKAAAGVNQQPQSASEFSCDTPSICSNQTKYKVVGLTIHNCYISRSFPPNSNSEGSRVNKCIQLLHIIQVVNASKLLACIQHFEGTGIRLRRLQCKQSEVMTNILQVISLMRRADIHSTCVMACRKKHKGSWEPSDILSRTPSAAYQAEHL